LVEILTVSDWLQRTNGGHLKDDVRELAPLGDGGTISIQASRYHFCAPRLDNADHYSSVEIGAGATLEEDGRPNGFLAPYLVEFGSRVVFARVPLAVAEAYVEARGGIAIVPASPRRASPPPQGRPQRAHIGDGRGDQPASPVHSPRTGRRRPTSSE
jgi:hypothetical protein